jgi:hypothetical protein
MQANNQDLVVNVSEAFGRASKLSDRAAANIEMNMSKAGITEGDFKIAFADSNNFSCVEKSHKNGQLVRVWEFCGEDITLSYPNGKTKDLSELHSSSPLHKKMTAMRGAIKGGIKAARVREACLTFP